MPKTIEMRSKSKNKDVLSAAESLKPNKHRPIRTLARSMEATSNVMAHHHAWGQLVFSDAGVTKVTTPNSTHIVPPKHGLWIPPDMEHAATLLEHAKLFSVYIAKRDRKREPSLETPEKWTECQAFKVSPLLHELIIKLSLISEENIDEYEYWAICTLIWVELKQASPLSLGVVLPEEKRLKALCNRFLDNPQPDISLKQLCTHCGVSLSTASRLFKDQLGMSFSQWRQQVILANALSLASQKMPINQIAYELGYASPSIFSAMVTRMVGVPPKVFFQY